MNAYERMIEVMRRQGKKTSRPAPMLGKMGKDGTIKLGEMVLEKSDYRMDATLILQAEETIFYHTGPPSGGELTASAHNDTLAGDTRRVLKEGDQVLVLRISTSGAAPYLLLAKVVAPT